LSPTLGSGATDRIEVEAFGGQLRQVFRQSTRLVRQLVLLCGNLPILESAFVQRLLGLTGILHHELHCPGRAVSSRQQGENVDLGSSERPCNLSHCARPVLDFDAKLLRFCHNRSSSIATMAKDYTRSSGSGFGRKWWS